MYSGSRPTNIAVLEISVASTAKKVTETYCKFNGLIVRKSRNTPNRMVQKLCLSLDPFRRKRELINSEGEAKMLFPFVQCSHFECNKIFDAFFPHGLCVWAIQIVCCCEHECTSSCNRCSLPVLAAPTHAMCCTKCSRMRKSMLNVIWTILFTLCCGDDYARRPAHACNTTAKPRLPLRQRARQTHSL